MLAYIKDRKTFVTKHSAQAQYDLTLHSIYDDVSTIYLAGTEDNALVGDIVYCDGFLGVITEVETDRRLLTLTCADIAALFSRDLFPTNDNAKNGIEAFLKRQIESNFVNVSDVVYRLPYIRVRTLTNTPSTIMPSDEDDVWNIRSFMAEARNAHNVYVDFLMEGNVLVVQIGKRMPPIQKVDLSMSNYEVLEETFSNENIGRITVRVEETGAISDWYLLQDGTITRTYTADNRVDGTWEKMTVGEDADVGEEVRGRFAENSYSHLIEFATTGNFGFCDTVQIRTKKGMVVESFISTVCKKSSDTRYIYKTGQLRNMIDE